ncbi:MAG: thioredoxin family protein [Chloroflexi bacterium]|nr:thioredoxin family protein [Chloroflexota bacterium]
MNAAANVSPERFAQGMTISQFRDGMQKNVDTFEENYRGFRVKPEDVALLRRLGSPLNVLVLAEEWCGDVLLYLPALARLAEAVGGWNVRIFYRDENPDLADQWLKEGKFRSIPVMVFLDSEMNERACYVEKPAAVYAWRDKTRNAFAAAHPELSDASLPSTDMSDPTRALYIDFTRQDREKNKALWQQLFVEEIKAKLQEAQLEKSC